MSDSRQFSTHISNRGGRNIHLLSRCRQDAFEGDFPPDIVYDPLFNFRQSSRYNTRGSSHLLVWIPGVKVSYDPSPWKDVTPFKVNIFILCDVVDGVGAVWNAHDVLLLVLGQSKEVGFYLL